MTAKQKPVEDMDEQELRHLAGYACVTPGCYNAPFGPYQRCQSCVYSVPQRADERAIAAKKRLAKLTAKKARA